MSVCLSSRTSETLSINICWDKRVVESEGTGFESRQEQEIYFLQ
jgi:hypothetical protein